MRDHAPEPTAGPVVTSIALGVAPLPLLAVYAVVFIAHGTLYPVNPPDITGSKGGELLAGIAALVLFALITCTIVWFMNRRRRWPFLLGQLVTLVTAIWFVIFIGMLIVRPSGLFGVVGAEEIGLREQD